MGTNADLHRTGHDAFRQQDMATMQRLITDDTVWHTGGRSQVSGTFKGTDAIFANLGKINELSGGTFKLEDEDFTESADHSVALSRITARRDGRSIDAKFVEVIRWEDGHVAERWGLVDDPYALDEFYS